MSRPHLRPTEQAAFRDCPLIQCFHQQTVSARPGTTGELEYQNRPLAGAKHRAAKHRASGGAARTWFRIRQFYTSPAAVRPAQQCDRRGTAAALRLHGPCSSGRLCTELRRAASSADRNQGSVRGTDRADAAGCISARMPASGPALAKRKNWRFSSSVKVPFQKTCADSGGSSEPSRKRLIL